MTEAQTLPPAAKGPIKAVPEGKVAIRDRDGTVSYIAKGDLAQAEREGAVAASGSDLRAAQVEANFGDFGSAASAAGINAFDQFTLGFGKGILKKGTQILGGEEAAKTFEQNLGYAEEANEGATFGGKALGLGLGLATGVGELGLANVAERGAVKALGKGITSSAVRLATEGGEYGLVSGMGEGFTEAELGNEDNVVEKMLASGAKGLGLGVGLGAGLGFAGGALGKAGSFALEKATGAIEGTTIGEIAARKAEEFAYSASGPAIKDIRKLAKYGVDEKTIGRFMLDELPRVSEKPFARMSTEEIGTASRKLADEYGEKISAAVGTIDVAAEKVGKSADAASILRRVQDEVMAPLQRLPGYESVLKKVATYTDSFGEKTGVLLRDADGVLVDSGTTGSASFKELHKFRQGLDDLIFRGNKALSDEPIIQELRQVRSIIEEEIGTQGSALSSEAGERYQAAKKGYRSAKTVADTATDKALRQEANRTVSLTDYISGVAGAAALGPGGAALALGNKVLREHGNQIAADILNRLGRTSTLNGMKASTSAVTNRITEAAKSIVRSGTRATTTIALPRARKTEKAIEQVRELALNPARVRAITQEHIDPKVAPNISAKYTLRTLQSLQYLAQSAPSGTAIIPALGPGIGKKSKPSRLELNTWQTELDVFNDPINVIEAAVKKGTLTADHVDALDRHYPGLAEELRLEIKTDLGRQVAAGHAPKFTKLLQLATVLKEPTDSLLEGDAIAEQQAIVSGPEPDDVPVEGEQAGGGVAPRTKSQRKSYETDSDRLEQGAET